MRATRLLGAATAAIVIAAPFAGAASAADAAKTCVGTGTISTSVLELSVAGGDVLSVRVLGNDITSTIDGPGAASTNLVPIAVASGLAPALNVASPTVSTSSTGAADERSHEAAVPAVPGFGGSLNAALSSVVDADGARAGLAAGLANLSLAGGLAKVPQGVVDLSTDAGSTQTVSRHTLSIPSATVLDLSALLEGLGLGLPDLSLDTLLDLVESLDLPLTGVADPRALVEDLNEAIATLEAETGTVTAELCATVDGVLGGGLGTVGGVVGGVVGTVDEVTEPLPDLGVDGGGLAGALGSVLEAQVLGEVDCDDLVGLDVDDVLQDVEDTLGSLLDGILKALDGVALLSVQGIEIGLTSTATDAVETSVADVSARIGSVKVGSVPVPGVANLDLTAPAAIVNEAAAAIQAQLDGVLGTIDSQLAGIVDVDVLDIEELVGSAEGGVVEAISRVTALRATITPPTGLLSAAAVDVQGTVAGALAELGTALPALDPLMSQLEGTLGGLDVLTDTTVLTVGTVSATSAFRPVAAQATPGGSPGTGTPGTLPRTGTDAALPAMAAVALAGMALAIRRLLRQTTI